MSNRPRSYGRGSPSATRYSIQVCIKEDVWIEVQKLQKNCNISFSGAAHHLMRLGAGLPPLPPLDQ